MEKIAGLTVGAHEILHIGKLLTKKSFEELVWIILANFLPTTQHKQRNSISLTFLKIFVVFNFNFCYAFLISMNAIVNLP